MARPDCPFLQALSGELGDAFSFSVLVLRRSSHLHAINRRFFTLQTSIECQELAEAESRGGHCRAMARFLCSTDFEGYSGSLSMLKLRADAECQLAEQYAMIP